MNFDIQPFKALDTNPGGTLESFNKYVDRIKLIFDLAFRKSDGTPYEPTDKEKKSLLLYRGGDDMKDLFEHVGKVVAADSFDEAITKIQEGLKERTNSTVQRNLLLTSFPQGSKSFEKWSKEITNTAKLISYTNYDWKAAAVDAMLLQTSNPKLRERALQEDMDFDKFLKLGIAKEQSTKGAAQLAVASGQTSNSSNETEEIRRLRTENKQLRERTSKMHVQELCSRCAYEGCPSGEHCPAMGQKCDNCKKMNHFARACRKKPKPKKKGRGKNKSTINRVTSDENSDSDSEESVCQINVVGNIDSSAKSTATLSIGGSTTPVLKNKSTLVTDTGVKFTILNLIEWGKIKRTCIFKKTSKKFRPYGIKDYHLPICGKAIVSLQAKNGARIQTVVYIINDRKEQSLLGKYDAIRLGIVKISPDGAKEAVAVEDLELDDKDEEVMQQISYLKKNSAPSVGVVSGGETQEEIDARMQKMIKDNPTLFSNRTGRYKGDPIHIHMKDDASAKVAPSRSIPLQYHARLDKEINAMLDDGVITGPLKTVPPDMYISNLVITTKKWDPEKIRVTLDCQAVNENIHKSHEPIPTIEQLRHEFQGSDRFSIIDITNCYHQFPLDEESKKLFGFRLPSGIYRYETLVQGVSPASGEAQKKIRELLSSCTNALNIKDDICIHGKGKEHDKYLQAVFDILKENGLTLRPQKCALGQSEVKWFGYIFSKEGMSPDPEKCQIIRDWPAPTNHKELKSFLQTVQFNKKFLSGKAGAKSFPDITEPLRKLTRKKVRFHWGHQQEQSFQEIKLRLCSDDVMVPYDTHKKTRLYVDSSPIGTQATLAQEHIVNGEVTWRPVNYTSRAWTPTEARYGQIERESNGILTGMAMNKLYTLGTPVEVITDHEPLVSAYKPNRKPKQLRVDRHRTKLLQYDYKVSYQPGSTTPSDYGSRHPPNTNKFSSRQKQEWHVSDEKTEILVNAILVDHLPTAITIDMLKTEIEKDDELVQLRDDILSRKYPTIKNSSFKKLFDEFTVVNDVIVREHRVVVPSSLQADVIGLAHEGHMGIDKTLNLLRETCWFPKMKELVTDFVNSCRPCIAASPTTPPTPLSPHLLPDRPWQQLHADFKGPIANKYYLHVIIDQYSKYPEVDIVKSTSFSRLEPCLDRVFATHGIPDELITDNGSPYFADEMSEYAKKMGFHLNPVSPENPQSNGFAESFVKILVKFIHTSIADGKDPKAELQNYLLQYRSAPHSTTGVSPAEALFGRKLKTKLPQLPVFSESSSQKDMRSRHDSRKLRQKEYFDKTHRATEKTVQPGDTVLLRQKKTTTKPPFDPKPYEVKEVKGKRVKAKRDGKVFVRDKNHIKVVPKRAPNLCPSFSLKNIPKCKSTDMDDDDYDDISHIINKDIQQVRATSSINDALLQIDEEERNSMQQLPSNIQSQTPIQAPHPSQTSMQTLSPLQAARAAVAAAEKPIRDRLRSAQRNLQWDSAMNGENILIEQQ